MKGIIITIFVVLAVASAFNAGRWARKLIQKIAHKKLEINQAPSTESDIKQVVKDNTNFAFKLFRTLDGAENQGNVIFSPYSISAALAMSYAGSAGTTKKQIKSTLNFENKNTHAVFRDLNSKLIKSEDIFKLKIANSLWSDKNHEFNQDFVDVVRYVYKGEAKSVDFKGNAEGAKKEINQWTAERTDYKIQNVLDSQMSSDAALVLVNTIYFKSDWAKAFSSVDDKQKFTSGNGKTDMVDMITATSQYPYSEGPGFKALTLPYKGIYENIKGYMTVILPDEGKFIEVKKNFNTDSLYKHFESNKQIPVEVKMPKFSIQTDLKLKNKLQDLGMQDPFTSSADFSRMDGTRSLFIQDVIHKAMIVVNEDGTEAAAATVVRHYLSSKPKPQAYFNADRPFIFMIHGEDRAVLFIGQVDHPTL